MLSTFSCSRSHVVIIDYMTPGPLPSHARFKELTRLVADELQKLEGLEFGISHVYGDLMPIVLRTPDGARRWPRIRIRKIDEAAIDGSLATLVEKVVLDVYPDFVVKPRAL